MPRTGNRKCSKDNEDDEWNPNQKGKKECKKKNKYIAESCFIHCTESNEGLTKLLSLESWKLLKAATVRQDEKLLQLAKSITNEDEYPLIYYHLKCRNMFTHKGTLDAISKVSYDLFFFNRF